MYDFEGVGDTGKDSNNNDVRTWRELGAGTSGLYPSNKKALPAELSSTGLQNSVAAYDKFIFVYVARFRGIYYLNVETEEWHEGPMLSAPSKI